jgi:hypothetical protein
MGRTVSTFGGPYLIASLSSMLGVRAGMNVSVLNAPDGFLEKLLPLPEGASLVDSSKLGLDVTVYFTAKKTDLIETLPKLSRGMAVMGAVWVVFPSESTDVLAPNEDFVRLAALEMGLTDTKKVLLDPQWVGLRLQWRAKPPRPELPQATA